MKTPKLQSTSHNACYDRPYSVLFTCSGSKVTKSFSTVRPVPDSYIDPSTIERVFDFSSDVSSGHVSVFSNCGLYFYRVSSGSFSSNSIGYTSLSNCLSALRAFAKSLSWSLVEWGG